MERFVVRACGTLYKSVRDLCAYKGPLRSTVGSSALLRRLPNLKDTLAQVGGAPQSEGSAVDVVQVVQYHKMPPLSYASNSVNEQARAAANRLWDPAAAPDLKPKLFRVPKAKPRKQHSHPIQPCPAASENGMFPVLPRVPPPARNLPHPQSVPAILSEKLVSQQERPQTPTIKFAPMLRSPSPPSPRPDVRQRRPSSASATHGMGIVPDPQRFGGSEMDESMHGAPAVERPAGSSTQQDMLSSVSPSLHVPQHAASESARGQPSGIQSSPRQQPASTALSRPSPRSTRASGSGRHILARSVRLRQEGTIFQAQCSEAPSMWGAAALTRDLNR
jgi:hypothetical protein